MVITNIANIYFGGYVMYCMFLYNVNAYYKTTSVPVQKRLSLSLYIISVFNKPHIEYNSVYQDIGSANIQMFAGPTPGSRRRGLLEEGCHMF